MEINPSKTDRNKAKLKVSHDELGVLVRYLSLAQAYTSTCAYTQMMVRHTLFMLWDRMGHRHIHSSGSSCDFTITPTDFGALLLYADFAEIPVNRHKGEDQQQIELAYNQIVINELLAFIDPLT